MLLGSFQGPVTAETTRLFLTNRDVLAAARSSDEGEKLGISVLPETAAEVAGFAKSTNSAPGLYLMVDVGAMTLDLGRVRVPAGAVPINGRLVFPICRTGATAGRRVIPLVSWTRKNGK